MNAALYRRPVATDGGIGPIAGLTGPVWLRDGSHVDVRFIRADDSPRLIELFQGLSAETIYRRFLHARSVLPAAEAARYADVDHRGRDALVACAPGGDRQAPIVAVARYAQQDAEAAEGGLVVDDAYQERGLGTILLRRLIALLRWRGFRYLRGAVLGENGRMLRLLQASGYPLRIVRDDGAYGTQLDLGIRRAAAHTARGGEHPSSTPR